MGKTAQSFSTLTFPEDVSKWVPQERIDRLKRGSIKTRFDYCRISPGESKHMRSLQGHSRRVRVNRKLQSNVEIPDGWSDYIYHVGHHGIAGPLPALVCSLEEPVEIEEGKHASSVQWILYKNLTFTHRIPLDSRERSHAERNGDGIRTLFVGSI